MEADYQAARAANQLVPLRDETPVEGHSPFHYWKIVQNRFPHDRHHTEHYLVVLNRDCLVEQVSLEELEELWYTVIPWADGHFDYIKLNMTARRTVNETPHLHLYVLKDEYK